MLLNHLLCLPTVCFTVHVSTDLAKMSATEGVALVEININGLASCPLCRICWVSAIKMEVESDYLIFLGLCINHLAAHGTKHNKVDSVYI